jgi:hypothetical protein
MQAIREIRDVVSEELVLHLPAEFLQQTVEVIILPLGEYAHLTPPELEEAELEKEIDELSWEMGGKLYTTRDQLYER